MDRTRLPIEVELVYEVMPCNALRTVQEPGLTPHPCTYFRRWGSYHSYDYTIEGAPPEPNISQPIRYVGRATALPEILTGCRKAPILALGINPNLPGWWAGRRRWLNPVFDDYRQFAHYFRYRASVKLEITAKEFHDFGGEASEDPFDKRELTVPPDAHGDRLIESRRQPQAMYLAYQSLLDGLAQEMKWGGSHLAVGEDLAYANMVACPSARWTTAADPADPQLPPMTTVERDGIVTECFHKRRYFLRQLFQSLPPIIVIFSQATANVFNAELAARFVEGKPALGEGLATLGSRAVRLSYGNLSDGTELDARVIYAPHATGNPESFAAARDHVVAQLVEEAKAGNIRLNPATKRLRRGRGACVFCPMLEIGICDYEAELEPVSQLTALTADSPAIDLRRERTTLESLMAKVEIPPTVPEAWGRSDEPYDQGIDG